MNVYKHTAVSFIVSALLLLALKKIQVSIACFLTGVFIDVDHVFDYYVNGDLKDRFLLLHRPRKLFSSLSADYARYKPDYLLYKLFHSVEILIVVPFLYALGLWNAIATGVVIGFVTHMIMDALPMGHFGVLSLSYKIRNGFPTGVSIMKQRLSRAGKDVEKCQSCGAGGETVIRSGRSTYLGFTTKALDKLMILCPDCYDRARDEENQKAGTDEHEKWNFRLFLINGIFTRIGFRLVDSSMVLAAFVKELTGSNVMVGLTSSTVRAGWMWPQLLVSNLLEHRPRKMPFYIFGVTARIISWMFILALTLSIGNRNYLLLFICFYALYFAAGSALGISTLPYNDIVAKSIPAQRRARLFSLRQIGRASCRERV